MMWVVKFRSSGETEGAQEMITPAMLEMIYIERGRVCEACGSPWLPGDLPHTVHRWSREGSWYVEGMYSVFCWLCACLVHVAEGESVYLFTWPHGLTGEEVLALAWNHLPRVRSLIAEWKRSVALGRSPWTPREEA